MARASSTVGRVAGWPGRRGRSIAADETGDLWLLNDTGLLFRCGMVTPLNLRAAARPAARPL